MTKAYKINAMVSIRLLDYVYYKWYILNYIAYISNFVQYLCYLSNDFSDYRRWFMWKNKFSLQVSKKAKDPDQGFVKGEVFCFRYLDFYFLTW